MYLSKKAIIFFGIDTKVIVGIKTTVSAFNKEELVLFGLGKIKNFLTILGLFAPNIIQDLRHKSKGL